MRGTSLQAEKFIKQDMSDDGFFYSVPRKVVHIDDHAIRALGDLFGRLLPAGGVYLDLMSSWRSHLPQTLTPAHVTGLGMNAEEMADNPALHDFVVHNLNNEPKLPFADVSFEAAMCTVSAQYLQQPLAVFMDVNRVLKPGGVFIVTFSNRCFPTKAVRAWLERDDQGRIGLVTRYFQESARWDNVQHEAAAAPGVDPLYAVWGFKGA